MHAECTFDFICVSHSNEVLQLKILLLLNAKDIPKRCLFHCVLTGQGSYFFLTANSDAGMDVIKDHSRGSDRRKPFFFPSE